MKYKFTVNKTKLYKLMRDNWPFSCEMPQFRYCDFKQNRQQFFWLCYLDYLQVHLTACGGTVTLVFESVDFGRVVVHPSIEDMRDCCLIKAVI